MGSTTSSLVVLLLSGARKLTVVRILLFSLIFVSVVTEQSVSVSTVMVVLPGLRT